MATIGTWGNPDGVFGGFTEDPEDNTNLVPCIADQLRNSTIMDNKPADERELEVWFSSWPAPITWEGDRYESTND